MNDIEKAFMEEIREKKRIGVNIFSRVATRKGGGNQALKTPYYFMSRKERKELNGEVIVYNMNNILPYNEFKQKSPKEQKELMEYWRKTYKTKDIMNEMGISRNSFYKILNELGIEIDASKTHKMQFDKLRIELSREEMERYLNGEFIEFGLFKKIKREQQIEILSKYLDAQPVVKELCHVWEGAEAGYLYNLKSLMSKRNKKENQESVSDNNNSVVKEDDTDNSHTDENIQAQASEGTLSHKKPKVYKLVKSKNTTNDKATNHISNIEIKSNTFNFELKGQYTADDIIRRLQLALEEIKNSNELLKLEIKITNH